jgi:hypothetical protein
MFVTLDAHDGGRARTRLGQLPAISSRHIESGAVRIGSRPRFREFAVVRIVLSPCFGVGFAKSLPVADAKPPSA